MDTDLVILAQHGDRVVGSNRASNTCPARHFNLFRQRQRQSVRDGAAAHPFILRLTLKG